MWSSCHGAEWFDELLLLTITVVVIKRWGWRQLGKEAVIRTILPSGGRVMPYDISSGGNLTTGRENGQELLATQRGKRYGLTDLNWNPSHIIYHGLDRTERARQEVACPIVLLNLQLFT